MTLSRHPARKARFRKVAGFLHFEASDPHVGMAAAPASFQLQGLGPKYITIVVNWPPCR